MFYPFISYEKIVGKILTKRGAIISTSESCTGGLICSLLTDISGSSEYIKSSFVTYSNEAKEKYLFVSNETINNYGAVSEQTAKEMALGLIKQTNANYALSITGIAGPSGGTKEKPVGLSYIGIANKQTVVIKKIVVPSFLPRKIIKYLFAKKALYHLKEFLEV